MTTDKEAMHQHRVVGDVLVSFATDGRVPDENMDAMLEDLRSKPITKFLGTDTGGVEVTSVQRASGAEIVREKGIFVVIVTDDRLMRGVATALSWLGANIKSYSWAKLDDAIEQLDLTEEAAKEILATVLSLKEVCESKAEARRHP